MKRLFKKLILRIFIALIALGLLAIPALYLIALNSPTVSAAWFNDNWAYRKAVSTTIASNSSDLSNLQMLLTVDTSTGANGIGSGKMQSSCQDLRFTNTNGKILPYYIDSGCTTTSTKIWVMVDLVPKNTTTMTLYMYYGNPSASSGSDVSKFNLLQDLEGYWTLNDTSGNRTDSSVNGNTLTDNNTVTSATGQYSNAGQFTAASTEYLSVSDNATLSTGDIDFTFTAWVYFDSLIANQALINKSEVSDREYQLAQILNGGIRKFNFLVTNTSSNWDASVNADSFGAVTTGNWYFVVAWHDSVNNTINIQVNNGVVDSTSYSGGVRDSGASFYIGAGSGALAPTDGRTDDVRFYKRVLSATEKTQLYTNPGTITTTAVATSQPTTSIPTDANAEKAPSPAAYWKFDDSQGQTAQDSTTNNNDGTLGATTAVSSDDPTWQTEDMCVSGKCLKFDGTDDYVNFGTSTMLNPTSAITVNLWAKWNSVPTSGGGGTQLIGRRTAANVGGWTFDWDVINSKICFYVYTTTWVGACDTTDPTISTWYHYLGVYDGSTVKLFVNGKQIDSQTQTGSINSPSASTVAGQHTIVQANRYFNGFLDDIKIYPYARSAAQIQADYNSRGNNEGTSAVFGQVPSSKFQVLSDGLVGYWKMDEASANSCTGGVNDNCDSSGNGNNGAWNGDATSAAGKYGNGTIFDGTGDYVDAGTGSSINPTNAISFGGWFYIDPTAAGNNGNIVHLITTTRIVTPTGGYLLAFEDRAGFGTNKIFMTITNGDNTYTQPGLDNAISSTGWYHIIGTYNKDAGGTDEAKLYINGSLVATGDYSKTMGVSPSGLKMGGTTLVNEYFNGKIDEARIYNRALSPAEVSALYNFAPGPKVYLKMDEKSGTSAFDSSGNGRTGTINGNPLWSTGKYGSGIKMDGTGDNIQVSDF